MPRLNIAIPAPRFWVGLTCALLAAVALFATYDLTRRSALDDLKREARVTAQLRVAVLQSELDKQRAVPVILADDSDVVAALRAPDPARFIRISQKLERLRQETRGAVIYLIDDKGVAVAASNWALPVSFVGENYGFRPYFRQAMTGVVAEQFALGTVSHKPGLYMAHSVSDDGKAIGVVVVKMEFDAIEASWAQSPQLTYVTDRAGKVVLTARQDLRFQSQPPVRTDEFVTPVAVPVDGWQLQVVSSARPALDMARNAILMLALALGLTSMLIIWQWRRVRLRQAQGAILAAREAEYRQRLEGDVEARTREISITNARLSAEIHDRRDAERRLSSLQADLVQANKLASLGQITAGVAHEINQPVATIRILADTSVKMLGVAKARAMLSDNLDKIIRMCERIGHITGELRTFSRKATGEVEPVPLQDTVMSSILLNQSRLHENRVALICDPIDPVLKVMAGRIRLEQVLVNLLQNAFEALEATPNPTVSLTVEVTDDWVTLKVIDNGPGLKPEVLDQLFTPFVTTKPKGLGLGLVIAHDILRDFGGDLSAESTDAGASFILRLKVAS
ncbi:ATP-binding protein [Asticcacaulis sp. ZE23SCel15]|uniref:sensor histidine kinase n=1 Tax=Asticcacaulis sp. ZE23SCel15 TaxID=3059027 RepID=UPI00265F24C2|nr:ATP-binding protein [Asticcacaulis sp. ZE23SCel15]WKL57586.1 ATP-binding protein [Asticcacaulis sp. ZE23SCel15]